MSIPSVPDTPTPQVPASVDLSGGSMDAAGAAFTASQQAARLAATRTVPGSAPSGVNTPSVQPTIPSVQVGTGPDER